MRKSNKQVELEHRILKRLSDKALSIAEVMLNDPEIQAMQEYANIAAIKRLGYNDHGPVHMRKSALNALIMFDLLHKSGIKFNLEKEKIGSVEDSKIAVLMATLLHDIGMAVTRENHEVLSIILSLPTIERIMGQFYRDDIFKRSAIKSIIVEGIIGHMATQEVYTIEAGLVLIGDGCDMEKGRARIPALLSKPPQVGDIHKHSAGSIQKVTITEGEKKPIKIVVSMKESVGLFQIEEVLFPKISSSPVKPYIELFGDVNGERLLQYL